MRVVLSHERGLLLHAVGAFEQHLHTSNGRQRGRFFESSRRLHRWRHEILLLYTVLYIDMPIRNWDYCTYCIQYSTIYEYIQYNEL